MGAERVNAHSGDRSRSWPELSSLLYFRKKIFDGFIGTYLSPEFQLCPELKCDTDVSETIFSAAGTKEDYRPSL